MYKCAHNTELSEGCKPSDGHACRPFASRQHTRTDGKSQDGTLDAALIPPPAPFRDGFHGREAGGAACPARTGGLAGGYGGRGSARGGGRGNARGGVAHAQTGSARIVVGAVVENASGRGVWGKGVVEAVIPAGVAPRYFCQRRGFPIGLFRWRTEVVNEPRYIVRGEDGRLHAPRRVRRVDNGN